MTARAIETERLSKRYLLGERPAAYLSLRDRLFSARGDSGRETLWALRDVTLGVDEGEVIGLVGRNGAGKSTLLKLVARITEPTSGVARMRGRVGALLEVGTGFHFELTGRENIFLNGAVLGMSRRDIQRRFDDIVEFGNIGPFLDTPLKRYSSGMYLRLAFAVAAHVEPDIVLVDEVLAVGDSAFQEKCLGKMSEFRREGRTVVFVSHDLGAIGRLCRRVVWIEGGRIRADGPTDEIVESYLRSGASGQARVTFAERPVRAVAIRSISITDQHGSPLDAPRRDQPLAVEVDLSVSRPGTEVEVAVELLDRQGVRILEDSRKSTLGVSASARLRATIPPLLAPGEYSLGVTVRSDDSFDERPGVLSFRVWPRYDDRQVEIERRRALVPAVMWSVTSRQPEAT